MRAAVAVILWAGAAQAGSYVLPDGCEGVATIQTRDCEVSHLFRCEPDTTQRHRVDMTDAGINYYGIIDYEARWIESHHLSLGEIDHLEAEVDPASLTELLATGRDTFDFTTLSNAGVITRYVGYDQLTGEESAVNGVRLLQTEFRMEVYGHNGEWLWTSTGREFVQPDWRSFVSGVRHITLPDEEFDRDGSPMQISLPGQPGFLTDRPLYGCEALMSSLEWGQG